VVEVGPEEHGDDMPHMIEIEGDAQVLRQRVLEVPEDVQGDLNPQIWGVALGSHWRSRALIRSPIAVLID